MGVLSSLFLEKLESGFSKVAYEEIGMNFDEEISLKLHVSIEANLEIFLITQSHF